MRLDYYCKRCDYTFKMNSFIESNGLYSIIYVEDLDGSPMKYSVLTCPQCNSSRVFLTEQSKLILGRSEKLKKLKLK